MSDKSIFPWCKEERSPQLGDLNTSERLRLAAVALSGPSPGKYSKELGDKIHTFCGHAAAESTGVANVQAHCPTPTTLRGLLTQ